MSSTDLPRHHIHCATWYRIGLWSSVVRRQQDEGDAEQNVGNHELPEHHAPPVNFDAIYTPALLYPLLQ